MPEDAKEATGHGVRAKRSNRVPSASTSSAWRAAVHRSSPSIASLAAALAKAQLPAAMENSNQIPQSHRWARRRRPHCAIDFSAKSVHLQTLTKRRIGRSALSPKRIS